MPIAKEGWWAHHAYFKNEGKQINIGLGRGAALDLFNEYIVSFERIR